jgi:hypothetical protein
MALSHFAVGTMIGYELYLSYGKKNRAYGESKSDKDNMRGVLFLRINYKLQNMFNPNYSKFNPSTSAIGDYDRFDYRNLAISLGVKYFFRLGILGKR